MIFIITDTPRMFHHQPEKVPLERIFVPLGIFVISSYVFFFFFFFFSPSKFCFVTVE